MIYPETNTVIVPKGRIDDAWREVMLLCIQKGYNFVVKGGSYIGQIRKQLDFVQIVIYEPGIRPLAPIMPPGIPPSTTQEKIENYFAAYLMSDQVKENEDYTYGSFIAPQIEKIIEILNTSNGNTNQACISIGDRGSVFLKDPPCLRLISFKVVDRRLDMTVYFRSWDLYSGLPENLGGLQLVKEYVLSNLIFDCADGKLIAYSDGLHLYEQYFDLANQLNIHKITVDEETLADKEDFCRSL